MVEKVRRWYDDNAAQFEQSAGVEHDFLHLTEEEQRRLNRFKLWFLEDGGLVSLVGKSVLEFGCGHGRLAIERPEYASYVGVDLSENLGERLAHAGLASRAPLVVSENLAFSAPRHVFNVVCSLGMFSCVVESQAVLNKLCSHLRPDGTLFVDGHHASPPYTPVRRWK